jgi:hypothetical protein
MQNDSLVTQPDVIGSNKALSFSTINYHEVNEQCQGRKSEIFFTFKNQFLIFYSPEQDKDRINKSFLYSELGNIFYWV